MDVGSRAMQEQLPRKARRVAHREVGDNPSEILIPKPITKSPTSFWWGFVIVRCFVRNCSSYGSTKLPGAILNITFYVMARRVQGRSPKYKIVGNDF